MAPQTFPFTVQYNPLPPTHQTPQQGKAAIDGGVELHGTEMIVYVFSGIPRIMCTTKMLRQAFREDLKLYRSASGFLYWAVREESIEDIFLCHPEAFCTRQGLTIRALSQAAPSDYFILHESR